MKKNHIIILLVCILLFGWLASRFSYVLQSPDSIASLVWYVILLCAIIPAFSSEFRSTKIFKYAAAWFGIFLVLFIGFSFKDELSFVGNRLKGNLLPHSATTTQEGEYTFKRSKDGHFHIEALVNQVSVRFMVDTGATKTTLTMIDAERIGIDTKNLSYNQPIQTASGQDFVATVHIKEIKVGDITINDTYASVSKNLKDHSLLGMNFLNKLQEFKISGDELTLKN